MSDRLSDEQVELMAITARVGGQSAIETALKELLALRSQVARLEKVKEALPGLQHAMKYVQEVASANFGNMHYVGTTNDRIQEARDIRHELPVDIDDILAALKG